MSSKLSILIEAIDRATAPIKQFRRNLGSALNDLKHHANQFHRAMEQATNLRFASQAIGEIGRKMSGALIAPVRSAADFETAMAAVNKVVDFKRSDGLAVLGRELRALSLVIPLTAAGLADIAAAGGQFGLPEDKLRDFTEMTAKVAVAWDILPEQAGTSIAKLANVFQVPITETQGLTDAINLLSNQTATKAPQITEALLRMGGNAQLFGLLREETAALATSMIELGRPPEVAARAVNTLLSRLQTADAQGKKFQAAMNFMGLSSKAFSQSIQDDAGGALLDFLGRLESLDKTNRAKALTFLFGEGFSDEIGILVGSLDKYRDNLARVSDATNFAGAVQGEFDKQTKTTNNGFVLLQNTIAELNTQLGELLIPTVRDLTDVLKSGITLLTEFAGAFPTLTKYILMGAAAVTGLFILLSPLLLAVAGFTVIFGGGATAMAGMGAAIASLTPLLGGLLALLKAVAVAILPVAGAVAAGGALGVGINNLPKLFGSKLKFSDMVLDLFMDDFDPNGPAPKLGPAVQTAVGGRDGKPGRDGRGHFNGKVEVKIDSEGRPRIKSVQSDNPDIAVGADVGMILAGGL